MGEVVTIRSTQTKHRAGLLAIAAACCLLIFVAYALPDLVSANGWLRSRLGPQVFPSLLAFQQAEVRASDLLQVYGRKATLARDVEKLRAAYLLTRNQPIDLFPRTAQIESLTELVRADRPAPPA